MRVNRKFLYAGLFLVAIGVVVVAADQGWLGATTLTDVVRLWPLAVIALGLGLVLRRTRVGLAAGFLAAAVPGLVLGSGLAAVPRFAGTCGSSTEPVLATTAQGTFAGPELPTIFISTGCGALDVRTAVGRDWRLEAGTSLGSAPTVLDSEQSLAIEAPGKPGWQQLSGGRDRWDVTLPATDINALEIRANASQARIDLAGTRIGLLELTANAAHVTVDATWSTFDDLTAIVNTGSLSLRLPNGADSFATVRLGGGNLEVCAPAEIGLSIGTRGFARQLSVNGVPMNGNVPDWQSDNYESATYRAELDIRVNFGSVSINPIGGCR